jgi:nicotinamidase-related amidase
MILKAFMSEARVCVIEDACACVTPESHKTAIEAMKTAQVDVR